MNTRVCLIQRVACDYRERFFLDLHSKLRDEKIELTVAAGQPLSKEYVVDILDNIPGHIRCRNHRILGRGLWTAGVLRSAADADLVIIEQANSALHNYPIITSRLLRIAFSGGRRKVAFWGHGATLGKERPQPIRKALKVFLSRHVDWWFAYNSYSQEIVENIGFPAERITSVQNSIDTRALRSACAKLTQAERQQLRDDLFHPSSNSPAPRTVGIFCGRLSANKEIHSLLQSISLLHEKLPTFGMIVIGDGQCRNAVETFCANNPWCVYTGPIYGVRKAPYLALADIVLNPGAVGLVILDAFAVGIPLATMQSMGHGPEIGYLRPNINGILSESNVEGFADAVCHVIKDQTMLQEFKTAAHKDGMQYSSEDMATRFAQGIEECLASPSYSSKSQASHRKR